MQIIGSMLVEQTKLLQLVIIYYKPFWKNLSFLCVIKVMTCVAFIMCAVIVAHKFAPRKQGNGNRSNALIMRGHMDSTAVWDGNIFVNLAPDPIPFNTFFAPLLGKFDAWQLASLTVGHQIVYDVTANWKIIFHNYSECYHCPTIHPRLNELTPFRNSHNDLEEGPILGGPMQMSLADGSMTMSGHICAPILQESHGLVHYYTIMPTIFLSIFPDYVVIHQLRPISPTQTQIICEWLFAPDAQADPNFNPQDAIDFWNMTNKQDWHVCELTQKGVQSKAYTPGPYSELESMLAAFDRAYLHVMNA